MPARPFDPSMNRRRRQVPGHVQALAFVLVLVGGAWGGQHGLGVWIGRAVLLLLVAGGVLVVAAAMAGLLWVVAWAIDEVLHDPALEDDGGYAEFGEPSDGEAVDR